MIDLKPVALNRPCRHVQLLADLAAGVAVSDAAENLKVFIGQSRTIFSGCAIDDLLDNVAGDFAVTFSNRLDCAQKLLATAAERDRPIRAGGYAFCNCGDIVSRQAHQQCLALR